MPILLVYLFIGAPIVATLVYQVVPLDLVSDGVALLGLVALGWLFFGLGRTQGKDG